mmetsp:Transcript_53578/g.59855  ORF Transcript_53578/g.59855 Transcript_53578/m.59855 type:complete len:80 (-) Transcript_53578:1435-1674(-)
MYLINECHFLFSEKEEKKTQKMGSRDQVHMLFTLSDPVSHLDDSLLCFASCPASDCQQYHSCLPQIWAGSMVYSVFRDS